MSENSSSRGARFASIVLWSVLPAAFIGPGTVTSCVKAGHGYGVALAWALTFSVLACAALQIAAARVSAASGLELAQAVRVRFQNPILRRAACVLVFLAIGCGCAAYQAGNVLGALAGLALLLPGVPPWILVAAIGVGAFVLLFGGAGRRVKNALSGLVFVMGVTFLATAFRSEVPLRDILAGSFVPAMPEGSLSLVLALVGTTVVPYNLFLGSSLAIGKDVRQARFGIAIAVAIGGIISLAIVVAGTAVEGTFSFPAIADALGARLGSWARPMFAIGLFAAGFTSAVTAPLAAALTIDALLRPLRAPRDESTTRFRATWMIVLGIGLVFGFLNQSPIRVILLAQAANGLLLPISAALLYLMVRDRSLVPKDDQPRGIGDLVLLLSVAVTILLGLLLVARSSLSLVGHSVADTELVPALAVAAVVIGLVLRWAGSKTASSASKSAK